MKSKAFFLILTLLLMPLLAIGQQQPPSAQETLELQQQLDELQKEIDQYEEQLTSVRSEKSSLTRKINELKWQQNKIRLEIQQSNLSIEEIAGQIGEVERIMAGQEVKIDELQQSVAALLRSIAKKDHYSWLEIWITHRDTGSFFAELADYKKLTMGLSKAVGQIQEEQGALKVHQVELGERQDDQRNLIAIANLQSRQLSGVLAERKDLLEKTQNREEAYEAMVSDREKIALEIKGRLYDLLGISQEITFGEAVNIAHWAESQTGVRTSFLLAILTQESNLGKNVGTCNRPGDPPEKSWKVIMKPDRDQEPFLAITSELGMNPDITPVSCLMKGSDGKQIGWGGAMGPAQFIPSTWMGYRDKVTAITGKSANPWDIRDAFLAAALLLKASGAGSESGEWAAAMRYFSGSTNPRFRFYGDSVVSLAEKYQEDIDNLNAG